VKGLLTKSGDKRCSSVDLHTVSDGLATNFLIPRSLAVPAAGGAYRAWQHDIASREDKRQRERADAEIAATRIGSTTLTMGVKVGDGGKLYGSIGTKEIAEALGRRRIVVDKHKIELDEPLKSLGPPRSQEGPAGLTPVSRWSSSPRADDADARQYAESTMRFDRARAADDPARRPRRVLCRDRAARPSGAPRQARRRGHGRDQ
jgi:large subunit ribosomal protein L9